MKNNAICLCCVFVLPLIIAARGVFAAEPEEAQYNAAVALYNAGQYDAALKKVAERQALEISDSMKARYLYVKGLIHERADKAGAAREAYETLLKNHPSAPDCNAARIALVYLDYAAGRSAAVAERYPEINQNGLPAEEKKNLALINAESLAAGKDDAKTIAAYRQALQLGADAAAINPRLFDLHLRAQRHQNLLDVSSGGIQGMDPALVALARAESALALKQYALADAEAKKVPADHAHGPRAAYAMAQALIGSGKPADAIEPLTFALQKMTDQPSPAAGWFTLAGCLSAAGKVPEAMQALAKAGEKAGKLPEAESRELLSQIAVLELDLASRGEKPDTFLRAFDKARSAVPADKLPDLLIQRLHLWLKDGNTKAIVASMADDYPLLQKSPHDGPATLIYYKALSETKRTDESCKCLEDFLTRKPDSAEAIRAGVELCNARMEAGQFAGAYELAGKVCAAPNAKAVLGTNVYPEVLYNRGFLALKLKDPTQAVQFLSTALKEAPAGSVQESALKTLGLAHLELKQYRQAADTWLQLLAVESVARDLSFRDQLARTLFLANDYKGALVQLDSAAALAGGPAKLPPDSLDVWARSFFELQQFESAAGRYETLYNVDGRNPMHAYACAVAWERAGKPAEATTWYMKAADQSDKLPATISKSIDSLLAQAMLTSRTGEMGAGYWLQKLAPTEDDKGFTAALSALLIVSEAGKLSKNHAESARALLDEYPAEGPRRYGIGALLARYLAGQSDWKATLSLCEQLVREFDKAEAKLPAGDFGATVAPAMIRFYRGEALRATGQPADALVEYETVLSVYPYNEWPDAAACGAAACFEALGDKATARARYEEVTKSGGKSSESLAWRALAGKHLEELNKGE